MTAYERYLLMLSQKAVETYDDMTQEEALELLIKEALFEQQPAAYELMFNAGQVGTYHSDSFLKAAQYLIQQDNANPESTGH